MNANVAVCIRDAVYHSCVPGMERELTKYLKIISPGTFVENSSNQSSLLRRLETITCDECNYP